jgi:predicted metal-dependent HD superfamily phosphohydrolase
MMELALRERFAALWDRLGGRGDGRDAFEEVYQAWREPHRSYHGVDHLRDCLARLDEAPAAPEERDLAEAALWYHDLVHQPGRSDNEARSADRAREALDRGGVPRHRGIEVARLVRLTDHSHPARDAVGALVCDVDLSILGRPREEFEEYERRIRTEYDAVPAPLYHTGRARILQRFLARDPLFQTEHFRLMYEVQARRNLRRSLETLGRM